MNNKHFQYISITKAICIILMVIGHSGCPQYLHDIIYLFHMPCFFFISGYLLNEKYIVSIRVGVWKRVIGLWWPYVKWSLLFLLLHNWFYSMHIYTTSYSPHDIITNFFKTFIFHGQEQLLQPYWFLSASLIASIITICFYHIFSKSNLLSFATKYGWVLFLILSFICSICPFNIPLIGPVQLLATSFYMIGYAFKNYSLQYLNKNVVIFLSIAYLFIPMFFIADITITGWKIFCYFPIATFGTILLLKISQQISKSNILDYIGKKTLYILTFHLLAFKIISYIKIIQFNWDLAKLSAIPVISTNNTYYWIGYSIAGVVVPLLIWEFSEYLQTRVKTLFLKKRTT